MKPCLVNSLKQNFGAKFFSPKNLIIPIIVVIILKPLILLSLVVNQQYDAEIIKEYVMRGNSAILKCSIPSFVADFVFVEAWIDENGEDILTSTDFTDNGKVSMQGLMEFNKNKLTASKNPRKSQNVSFFKEQNI